MVIKMNEKRLTSGPMVLPPMVFNNFHAEYGSVLKLYLSFGKIVAN